MYMPGQYSKVDEILELHGYNKSSVIAIIQDIQKEFRYLPAEILSYVAEKLGLSEAKIYSVATFYENFSLEPKGKYVIQYGDRLSYCMPCTKVYPHTECYQKRAEPLRKEAYHR